MRIGVRVITLAHDVDNIAVYDLLLHPHDFAKVAACSIRQTFQNAAVKDNVVLTEPLHKLVDCKENVQVIYEFLLDTLSKLNSSADKTAGWQKLNIAIKDVCCVNFIGSKSSEASIKVLKLNFADVMGMRTLSCKFGSVSKPIDVQRDCAADADGNVELSLFKHCLSSSALTFAYLHTCMELSDVTMRNSGVYNINGASTKINVSVKSTSLDALYNIMLCWKDFDGIGAGNRFEVLDSNGTKCAASINLNADSIIKQFYYSRETDPGLQSLDSCAKIRLVGALLAISGCENIPFFKYFESKLEVLRCLLNNLSFIMLGLDTSFDLYCKDADSHYSLYLKCYLVMYYSAIVKQRRLSNKSILADFEAMVPTDEASEDLNFVQRLEQFHARISDQFFMLFKSDVRTAAESGSGNADYREMNARALCVQFLQNSKVLSLAEVRNISTLSWYYFNVCINFKKMNPHPHTHPNIPGIFTASSFVTSKNLLDEKHPYLWFGRFEFRTLAASEEQQLKQLVRWNMSKCKCSNPSRQCIDCTCEKRGLSCIFGCSCFDLGRGQLVCQNKHNYTGRTGSSDMDVEATEELELVEDDSMNEMVFDIARMVDDEQDPNSLTYAVVDASNSNSIAAVGTALPRPRGRHGDMQPVLTDIDSRILLESAPNMNASASNSSNNVMMLNNMADVVALPVQMLNANRYPLSQSSSSRSMMAEVAPYGQRSVARPSSSRSRGSRIRNGTVHELEDMP